MVCSRLPRGTEASGDDGGHGFGTGFEGLVKAAQNGAEDHDEFGRGEEGAVPVDVLGEVFGAGVAPAVEEDGGWVCTCTCTCTCARGKGRFFGEVDLFCEALEARSQRGWCLVVGDDDGVDENLFGHGGGGGGVCSST